MKTTIIAITSIVAGFVISGTIYTFFIVANIINQTNSNTANITSIIEFLNKQIDDSKPSGQGQSIAK